MLDAVVSSNLQTLEEMITMGQTHVICHRLFRHTFPYPKLFLWCNL